jgi:geranylgeranyl diphosphate synthase type II
MRSVESYQKEFIHYLKQKTLNKEPANLYEPIKYILNLGGKRLRPVLTLMASELFGADFKEALGAAMAIEIFHNFSLVHDDIMDSAPLRRGKPSVHVKWDINTGILSGDAMLILAYSALEDYKGKEFRNLTELLSQTAIKVCEGQQYDVDFETRHEVSVSEYLKMIEYKTAVLIGAALQMGAIVAGASEKDQHSCYEFGKNLGIAFQLKDDYLDAFADPDSFGKQTGGDIIENKKTYLFLKAMEFASEEERAGLKGYYSDSGIDNPTKVEDVKRIFKSSGAAEATQDEIRSYTFRAFSVLDDLDIPESKKAILRSFGERLMNREV